MLLQSHFLWGKGWAATGLSGMVAEGWAPGSVHPHGTSTPYLNMPSPSAPSRTILDKHGGSGPFRATWAHRGGDTRAALSVKCLGELLAASERCPRSFLTARVLG